MTEQNENPQKQVGLVIGIVLIAIGVWAGFSRFAIFALPANVTRFLDRAQDIRWPLAAVVCGVALIVVASRPGFRLPSKSDRLYKSSTNRILGGVLGGIAKYFGVDATLVRLGYIAAALILGVWTAALVYFVLVVVVPREPAQGGTFAPPPPSPPTEGGAAGGGVG